MRRFVFVRLSKKSIDDFSSQRRLMKFMHAPLALAFNKSSTTSRGANIQVVMLIKLPSHELQNIFSMQAITFLPAAVSFFIEDDKSSLWVCL